MKGTWLGSIGIALLVGICGCSSQSQPPKASDQATTTAAPMVVAEPLPPPPEPVAAPANVVVRARVKSPELLASALSDAASSPISLRQLLGSLSPEAARVLDEVLDPAAPVEGLMVLNPVSGRLPLAAFSLAARGIKAVLGALDEQHIEYREGPSEIFYFAFAQKPCAVGRSRGPSQTRIVCAESEESLRALAAYMMRGLPDERLSDSPLHVEFIAAPVQEAYGRQVRQLRLLASVLARQLHSGNAKFDAALSAVATGLADELAELLEDAERIDLDLLEKERSFDISLRLTQRGQVSFTAQAFKAAALVQAPAPPAFRALPAEVTSALFLRGLPSEVMDPVTTTLTDLVAGSLAERGLSTGSSTRAARALIGLSFSSQPLVWGAGPLTQAGEAAGPGRAPAFHLFSRESPPSEIAGYLGDLAAVATSREFEKAFPVAAERPVFKRLPARPSGLSQSTAYEFRIPERVAQGLDVPPALGGKASGKRSDASRSKVLAVAQEGFLVLVEHEAHPWVSIAPTLELAVQGLQSVVAADGARLATAPEVKDVLLVPAFLAGFTRIEGIVGFGAELVPPAIAQKLEGMLKDAPHGGRHPVSYSLRTSPTGRLETDFVMHLPSEFVTDALALGLMAIAELSAAASR